MRRQTTAVLSAAALAVAALLVPAGPATAAGNTLTVDVGTVVRPVTHVAAGGLYAVGSDSRPTTDQLLPLSVNGFTQPPPGTTHLGNGATQPCCDALSVAGNITRAGGQQLIRMPDIYPTFPYRWAGWPDWEQKVRTMVRARLAATTTTNIMGWELWNEPDWTWETAAAGSFHDGWTRTFRLVRSLDPVTPIVGPSWSWYDPARMRAFLTHARDTGTVPDVIVWHELGDMGWNDFAAHVADYRALERSLGISPRQISINEYNSLRQMDIPSVALHWMAVLERHGARDAHRAYWFEAGTFNGLFTTSGRPTASYWAYRWYGDMAGNIVRNVPQSWLDGVASYDSTRRIVNVVLGGDSGNNAVRLTGLGAFGSSVRVTVSSTPGTGRGTAVAAPTVLSSSTVPVTNGSVTVPVNGMTAEGVYQVLVTPAAGPTTSWQQVYEAENATVVNAATRTSSAASNGAYVGGIDGVADMRSHSFVDFVVNVPTARSYTMAVRYANGTGATSTHGLAYNGGAFSTVSYAPTAGWAQFATANVTVQLRAGYNVIRLAKGAPSFGGGVGYAELDSITLR
ncbi:CBM35 domain-containing protein [Cellulomonas shaoxiangyii]|uniref:Carbohydrate-binding protein n=1 Tax=Cellulomonas shaoxiangyii TaxID=2566013 RepID=A0A4P7SIT8_9CELL|nr:CBM35 domain-containing protein [Cellulomonas shaoxiangyii]QCB93691.1 carbohydrate-binding protein [Cellulomonas shaoxiangyii]TGY86172.1 carbohydrate-binding protein [Cellulomonas shaoxiangyii]